MKDDFIKSHGEIVKVIQSLPNEVLFGRGHYRWTGSNTLGAYFVSATSSHYLWARNEIKKGMRVHDRWFPWLAGTVKKVLKTRVKIRFDDDNMDVVYDIPHLQFLVEEGKGGKR